MSGVRMHFWQVVTRLRGGVTSPVKNFFIGAMPELMRRRDLSPFGTSEKLGRRKCPLLSKKLRYFSLSSFNPVHCIRSVSFLKMKIPPPQHGTEVPWYHPICTAKAVPLFSLTRKNAAVFGGLGDGARSARSNGLPARIA